MADNLTLTNDPQAAPAGSGTNSVTFLPPNPEHIPSPSPEATTSGFRNYWDGEDLMAPVAPDEELLAHVRNLFSDHETLGGHWNAGATPFSYLMTLDDRASIANRQFVAVQMGISVWAIKDTYEAFRNFYAYQHFGPEPLTASEFYGKVQEGYATRDARYAAMADAAGNTMSGLLNGTDPSDPDQIAQWVGRHEGVLQDAPLGTAWRANAAVQQAVRSWLLPREHVVRGMVNKYGPESAGQRATQFFMQQIRETPDGAALFGGNPAMANGVTFLPNDNPERIPQPDAAAPKKPRFGYVRVKPWVGVDPTGIWSFIGTDDYWHGVGDVFKGYYDVTVGAALSAGEAVMEAPRNAVDLFSEIYDQSQLSADTILPTLGGAVTETGKDIVAGFKDFGEQLYEGDNRAGGQLVGSILMSPAGAAAAAKLAAALKVGIKLSTAEEVALKVLNKDKSAVPLSKAGSEESPLKVGEDASKAAEKVSADEELSAQTEVERPLSVADAAKNTTGRGYKSFAAFKYAENIAEKGKAWHHIVGQTPENIKRFGAKAIHNTENLVQLPHGKGMVHNQISGFYSSKPSFTGKLTVRKWLSIKSFEEQAAFGQKTLQKFNGAHE